MISSISVRNRSCQVPSVYVRFVTVIKLGESVIRIHPFFASAVNIFDPSDRFYIADSSQISLCGRKICVA